MPKFRLSLFAFTAVFGALLMLALMTALPTTKVSATHVDPILYAPLPDGNPAGPGRGGNPDCGDIDELDGIEGIVSFKPKVDNDPDGPDATTSGTYTDGEITVESPLPVPLSTGKPTEAFMP